MKADGGKLCWPEACPEHNTAGVTAVYATSAGVFAALRCGTTVGFAPSAHAQCEPCHGRSHSHRKRAHSNGIHISLPMQMFFPIFHKRE